MNESINEQDLEKEETWDLSTAEKRSPSRSARAVLSVAFARDDFDKVSDCADLMGMKVSEFVREAALEKVAIHKWGAKLISYSYTPNLVAFQGVPMDITRAFVSRVRQDAGKVLTY